MGPRGLAYTLDDAAQGDAEFFGEALGRLFGEVFEDGLEFCTGLRGGDSGTKLQRAGKINVWILRYVKREINFAFAPFEAGRHDADDFISFVNELHFVADDVGVAAEIALPELVAENDDALRIFARRSIGGNQPAAFEGGDAEMVGRVGGKVDGLNVFGEVTVGGGQIPKIHAEDAFEGFGLAKLGHLGAGETGEAVVAGCVDQAKLHDAIGAGVGERIDEDGVDDAEDGASGSNAEGEGEDGGQREAGALAEFASGVAQVGRQRLHGHLAGNR